MKDIILHDILIPSLKRLYQEDYNNIKFGVSERNVCARLAHHIENIMREYADQHYPSQFQDYYADVEYNRMSNGDYKFYEDSLKRPRYMVSDLLIHCRGHKRNLLAVEMKRKGNKVGVDKDKERLSSLVTAYTNDQLPDCVHDTLLSAFIEYSTKGVYMDLFEFSSETDSVSISQMNLPETDLRETLNMEDKSPYFK